MSRKSVPNSRDPEDWKDAGYSESSAKSHAYRGGLPKLEGNGILILADAVAAEILLYGKDEARVKVIDVIYKHKRKALSVEEEIEGELFDSSKTDSSRVERDF